MIHPVFSFLAIAPWGWDDMEVLCVLFSMHTSYAHKGFHLLESENISLHSFPQGYNSSNNKRTNQTKLRMSLQHQMQDTVQNDPSQAACLGTATQASLRAAQPT